MDDRGHLSTELPNPRSENFDTLSIAEAFDVMSREDASVAQAVADAGAEICQAIQLVVKAFRQQGRLVYVGAGTSGRLGVLDAAECPPTFLTDPRMVTGIIAGGDAALTRSIEGAEDRPEFGGAAMDDYAVGPRDVVFGIATGGTTPFVHGALARAKQLGAKTIFMACVSKDHAPDDADVSIRVLTGPEVLTGSTRLKAGTATKMVLNRVSTIAMVRIGKAFGNLMVDVNTGSNRKLVDRGIRILQRVAGLSRRDAADLLKRAEGRVKPAIVMQDQGVDLADAQDKLERADGHLSRIVGRAHLADAATIR